MAIAGIPNPLSTLTGEKVVGAVAVGAAGAANVTAAVPTADASATDVAVTVTVPTAFTLGPDVYVTAAPEALVVGEIVPHTAPMQFVPDIDHVTPRFCASFATFAVKVCVTPPVARFAVPGVTDTLVGAGVVPGAGVNVIVAFAVLVVSSTAVAVSVTVGGFGTAAGAVYVTGTPEAELAPDSLPHVAPMQPDPESVHVVPSFFGSSVTLALKLAVWLACTVAEPGASVTAIVPTGAGLVEDPPPHPENPATAIITHAQTVATFLRATPREHTIYPPEMRSGTGAAF
ncbi:MAG TPA: hypothetical protein VIH74_07050 [Candidatus Acidoferrum sp.]